MELDIEVQSKMPPTHISRCWWAATTMRLRAFDAQSPSEILINNANKLGAKMFKSNTGCQIF